MFSIETKTSKPKDITYILHPDIPSSSQDAGGWLCVEIICNSMRPCSRHIPHNPISVFTQIFLFILPAPHPGWCCSHRRFCGDNRLSTMHRSFQSQDWLPRIFPGVKCCPRLAFADTAANSTICSLDSLAHTEAVSANWFGTETGSSLIG